MSTQKLQNQFRALCNSHDLTYEYSDDHLAWTRGRESMSTINDMAKKLDPAEASKIWNEVVDTKVVESARQQFYKQFFI